MRKILFLFLILIHNLLFAQIPTDNLKLWLRADSVEIINDKIATWYDLTGNGYHAVQPEVSQRPVKVENALNSHPILRYNGISNNLHIDFIESIAQPLTIFVIWNCNSTIASQAVVYTSTNNVGQMIRLFRSTTDNMSIYSGTSLIGYSKPGKFNYILSTAVYNSISSIIYENGAVKATGNAGYSVLLDLYIGRQSWSPQYLNGDLAEIIMYDNILSTDDQISIENYLMDKYSPNLNLGSDMNIAYGFCDTTLVIDKSFIDILWSTGETNDTIYVNQSGEYTVQAKDIFGRIQYDTINVQFPTPNIADAFICLGDSVLYNPNLIGSYSYLWSDLTTEESKYYKDEGDYWLRIEDDFGCFDTVFFTVAVDSFKNNISLGNDTSLCSGNTIQLIQGEALCSSFLWTANNNTEPIQIVNETGWQKVEVENENGCKATDSIYVTIIGTAPIPDYIVENLCFGDTTHFIDNSTSPETITDWKWIINENDTLYTQSAEWVFETIGIQNIELIVESESGCANNLNFTIEILPIPDVSFTYTPVCTGVEMSFVSEITLPAETNIEQYNWFLNNIGISNNANFTHLFTANEDYELTLNVQIDNGCAGEFENVVQVENDYPIPSYLSLISPQNNTLTNETIINFVWNYADDAVFYNLQITNDTSFQNLIFSKDSIFSNNFTYSFTNEFDTVYWKVIAYNPCLISQTSVINRFSKYNPQNHHPKLWLDADSVNSIENKVNIWYDKSGNNFNCEQINLINQPSITTNIFNNRPFLKFNGLSTYLIVDFEQEFIQPNTFFIVWSINRLSPFAQFAIDGLDTEHRNAIYWQTASELRYFAGVERGYQKFIPFATLLTTAIFDSPNSKLLENGDIKSALNPGTHSLTGLTIGNIYSGTDRFLNGDIAEVIFYDTVLSDSARQMVERYLHDKYFPPINLLYDIRVPYGFCDTAITTAYKPWFTSYEWSTGETDSIIHVNKPGLYSVTVTDIFGFESNDDIRVFYPQVNDFADTIVCLGETAIWDLELAGDYTYQWYGSSELTRAITITDEGSYAAIISDTTGCKYYSDTISFSFDNYEFTASVGPNDTALCSGNRLMLVSNADETVNYNWSTGGTNHEIVLTESGTYSVTTTNWRGCVAQDTIDVNITGTVPVPLFSSLGHCAKNPVYFTDLSTATAGTINSWTWSINGEIFSNEQNPILAESNPQLETSEPETKEITLQISTDADCGDFISIPLNIYPLPVVSFTPDLVCQNTEIEFTSTSYVNGGEIIYNEWDYGNGSKNGSQFTVFGSQFTVRSSKNGSQFTVHSYPTDLNGEQRTENREQRTENGSQFTVRSSQLSDGFEQKTENREPKTENREPLTVFPNSGYHIVQLISTSDVGCTDSIKHPVFVKPATLPEFTAANTCVGQTVSFINSTIFNPVISALEWNWDFGDDSISQVSSPQHIYQEAGEYNVNLGVSYSNGCELSTTNNIEVYHNPEVNIENLNACEGATFTLSSAASVLSGNIESYNWQIGDPVIMESQLAEPEINIAESGKFPIKHTVSSNLGCKTIINDTLIVHENPLAAFSASRTWGAVPLWIDFTNNSQEAESYYWQFDPENFSTDENPYHIFTDSGTYIVQLSSFSQYGCYDTAELTIRSVIPIMDIMLYSLRTDIKDNYLTTSVYIINNGTLPVAELNLDLNLGNGKIYRETIANFQSGQVIDYTFSFKPYLSGGTLPEVVCVEAPDPTYSIYTDIDFSNNIICNTNVENLIVFQPYPNPASDNFICEFITAKTENVTISLINGVGKIVYENQFNNNTGYTKTTIDISTFSQGIYYLQVRSTDESKSYKVEIN